MELAGRLLVDPLRVNIAPEAADAGRVRQTIRLVSQTEKFPTLHGLVSGHEVKRTIVFSRTKRGANRIVQKLGKAGVRSMAIHGNKSQGARQKALENFRDNRIPVLVATEVAARGLDIAGVTHVINFDMPPDPDSYIHRIGRTGRAGAEGVAISLCTPQERSELHAIERVFPGQIDVVSSGTSAGNRPVRSPGRPAESSALRPAKSSALRRERPAKPRLRHTNRKTARSPAYGQSSASPC
jgi:ATP-dependent RNA helicase RhlE